MEKVTGSTVKPWSISTCQRLSAYCLAIDVEKEGIVGADADDEVLRLGGEIDCALKVEDGGRVGREHRGSDPVCVPGLFGGALGCGVAYRRDDDEDGTREVPRKTTHSLS
jgi:hypothetical protein